MIAPQISGGTAGPLASISLVYFAAFLGNSLWRTTFNNFAVESLHLSGQQVALLFSIAAIPGVFAFGVGLLSRSMKLFLLLTLTSSLLGGGLILTGVAGNWLTLALGVFVMTTGFTFFYPVANSVAILASDTSTTTLILGRLKSYGPLAGLGAALILLLLLAPGTIETLLDSWNSHEQGNAMDKVLAVFTTSPRPETDPLRLRTLFGVVGATIIALGALAALTIHRTGTVNIKSEFRLRWALWSFYLLNFLAGCRSGLFQAFVLFLLVGRYGLQIHGTALLVICGHVLSFAGYRVIGRLARAWSPRRTLILLYTLVAGNFLGFAWLALDASDLGDAALLPLMALFLVDSLIFGASVITDASLKDLEHSPSLVGNLATGATLYYLGVAAAPFGGALLVERFDFWAAFLMGAALALIAVIISRWLPAPPVRTIPE